MSANKNLSKLALNVSTSGKVTDTGLETTFVSNSYFQNTEQPLLVSNGFFNATYTAADVLTKIKTVDGAGSGLDADTLDGANSTFFTNASNINTGTLSADRLSGTYSINISGSSDTVDGLEATDLTSNNYVQGRYASNSFVKSIFTSNNYMQELLTNLDSYTSNSYVTATFISNNYVQDRFTTNNYVRDIFSSNNYLQSVDFKADINVVSNNYVEGRFTSNNFIGDRLFPIGGGTDNVFFENDQTVTTNYTITTGKNAMSAGPISVDPGVTITIPTGSYWSII